MYKTNNWLQAAPLLGFVFEIQFSFFANRPASRAITGLAKCWDSIEYGSGCRGMEVAMVGVWRALIGKFSLRRG